MIRKSIEKLSKEDYMGRPKKEIDQRQFENLCGLQCTLEEICGWFDVCSDTLETWCKRTYKRSFSEVFAQKRGAGKISLRRSQWRLAEKNANMAIWLGKQYLGQKDQEVQEYVAVHPLVSDLVTAVKKRQEDGHAE